ncbi:BatA domain-containing protein [Pontibacter actiniarum]|uniref:BatA domain-containing protein n=1 Tax=Pontibacter actiniarum TaxID=323450 RepID=UPI00040DEE57|nr:BatA domain-containing protein [Pontibacter actiniarum]
MTFLAPYWLFAASGILIPVAIHLWNKRQGKRVKVGSLRWLEPSASKRWSSIKLNDVWLLLLRCLILILLAVALAQPVWVHQPKVQGQKVVYVGPELLYSSARASIQPTLDSLLQRGYTLHSYTSDFEKIPQEAWEQLKSRTQDSTLSNQSNYWSLLPALADKYKKPQDSVWLFTSDQQTFFAGARPEAIPENIRWIPVATTTTADWLQAAVQTSPDSLLLLIGQSTREDVSYSRYRIKASTQSINLSENQSLKLRLKGDSLLASTGNTSSQVKIQAEPLQVAVLASKSQQAEVKYLRAALQAISSYTSQPINLKPDITNADWLFWLQEEELPTSIKQAVSRGQNVWVQQRAKSSGLKASMATAAGNEVLVRQVSTGSSAADATAIWTTQAIDALLSAQQIGSGRLYTFRSGFGPAWSELGESGQLPGLLLPLLFPQAEAARYDMRALDEQQLMPTATATLMKAATPEAEHAPLLKWVVLAAFMLFLIERFIAGRRSKV